MPNLHLCDLDLNKNALLNPVIHPVGTAPSNPVEGQIYYDNTGGDKQIYVWNGSAWVSMGGDVTSVVAGTGLTGGGTGGAITLNVIGGTGITANANDIAITAGGVGTTQLADNGVTEDKLADTLLAEIDANTAKITNVSTNLGITGSTAARTITSSDGTNAVIPLATTSVSGLLSPALFDEIDANTAKATNVTTNLSVASSTGARVIASSDGTNATIPIATTSVSGVMSTAIFDAVTANTAKVTNTDVDVSVANLKTRLAGGFGSNAVTIGDSSDVVTIGNDLTVTGDLIVSGTTTTLNTANLTVEDNNIILSSGNTTSAAINGAGITLEGGSGSDATITYNTTGPKFEMKLGSNYEDLKVDTLHAAALTIPDNAIAVGKIAAGTLPTDVKVNNSHWSGTVLASSNLDADTAHLTTTQTFTGAKTFTGTVALTGTGRITGIDTVSAATDAASKTYVDAHVWDGSDITSGTIVSARLDADTAHLSGSQTFTGTKTLNSFKGTGSTTVTNILDEDNMASDSATALATQQSIKAYVDDTTAAGVEGKSIAYSLAHATTGVAGNSGSADDNNVFTITHGLGSSLHYMVQVIASDGGATVFPCVTRTTTTVVVTFNANVTAGAYIALIVKI